MIYIEKDTVNQVVLTLSENSRLVDPFYLFIFTNEYTIDSTPITFTTPDISMYTNRYNQFVIVESESGSEDGGIDVPMKLTTGQWNYIVYESEIETLSVTDTTGRIVEEGRMVVSGNDIVFTLGASQSSIYE